MRNLLVALLLAILLQQSASAGPLYWDINGATAGAGGGTTPNGTWNTTTTNWNDSAAGTNAAQAWVTGADAVFSSGSTATGSYTVTVFGGLIPDVKSITFEEGTVTIAATNGSSGIQLTGPTLSASAGTHTINPILSGSVGIDKTGAGTIVLGGANTFTGTATVTAGVLNIQNAAALGSTADGTTVSTGAELQIQGNISVGTEALTLNGSGIGSTGALRNISGTNSWSGAVTLGSASKISSDAGTLTLSANVANGGFLATFDGAGDSAASGIISGTGGLTKNGAGTLTLSGLNTYGGTTTINAGQVTVSTATALGTGTINLNGGTLFHVGTLTFANALNVTATSSLASNDGHDPEFSSNSITGTAGATLNLVNVNGLSMHSWMLSGSGFNFASDVNMDIGSRIFLMNASGTQTFSGSLTGTGLPAGAVSRNTAGGTTILSGTNSFTGLVTVIGGTLIIQNSAALGTTASGTTVSSGADLRMQGNINVGAEALSLAGTGIGGAGALRNVSGSNSWAGAVTLTADSTIASDSGTLTISGGIGGPAFGLTVGGAGNTVLSGVIGTTTGTLTKTGTGRLTLSGANTYTGATTVSAGRLAVTGSLTSAITVASGASLSGQGGTTSSTLALNAGSTIVGVPQVAGSGNAFRAAGAVTAGASVLISGSDGSATVGAGHTIDVVGYGTTPGTANFSTANYRSATVADDTTNTKITLTYTNAGRTWNSAASTWDVGTTTAWQEGDFKFFQGDTVTFNDTGTGGGGARTVTLNSAVTPGGVIFNNATSTYTVSGTGSIGGATALTKTGSGTANLATANTFSGNTTVSGGTLSANADGALGSTPKVTINTGGTVLLGTTTGSNRISNTAEVALAGGTLNTGGFSETVGKMTLSANSTLDLGAGASLLTFDGTSSLGSSTLTVLNWTGTQGSAGGTDRLLFDNSSFVGGTSSNQIEFNIGGTRYNANFITIDGNTVEAVAGLTVVPEPATIFGASALMLAIAWRERRRFALLLGRV